MEEEDTQQDEELVEVAGYFYPDEDESFGSRLNDKLADGALDVLANVIIIGSVTAVVVGVKRSKKKFDSWKEARKSKKYSKQEDSDQEDNEK